ncbi:hypothetical protein D3C85_924560 [compost metagenome]
MTVELKPAKFNGQDIQITTQRIPAAERKPGYFYYEMRHGNGQWTPLTIEHGVLVNFCGTIESRTELLAKEVRCYDLTKEEKNSLRTYLNRRIKKKEA